MENLTDMSWGDLLVGAFVGAFLGYFAVALPSRVIHWLMGVVLFFFILAVVFGGSCLNSFEDAAYNSKMFTVEHPLFWLSFFIVFFSLIRVIRNYRQRQQVWRHEERVNRNWHGPFTGGHYHD